MSASSVSAGHVSTLRFVISGTLDLLSKFESTLSPSATGPTIVTAPTKSAAEDPLLVLHASATLVKAHTTKLSLLALNQPFTPSAISSVLRDLGSGPLPVLVNAATSCPASQWGITFHAEVHTRAQRVLRGLRALIEEIPLRVGLDDVPLSRSSLAAISSSSSSAAKDDLASTGQVWAACDAITALKELELGGLLVQKAEQHLEMLVDAIGELDDWSKESVQESGRSSPNGKRLNGLEGGMEGGGDGDGDGDDDFAGLFAPNHHLPRDAVQLRSQLVRTLKRLKLVAMLYKAIIKRRLSIITSPPASHHPSPRSPHPSPTVNAEQQLPPIHRLDEAMTILSRIPSETDEMASSFYELDGDEAALQLAACTKMARRVVALVLLNWSGTEDECSAWLRRWSDRLSQLEREEGD